MTENETAVSRETAVKAKRRNLIILLAAAAILLNGAVNFFESRKNSAELIKLGTSLPEFSVKQADGSTVSTAAFKGKPVIYYFFANWCPCSHASIGFVKRAVAENVQSGMTLFSVGIQDSASEIEKFSRKHDISTPVGVSGGNDVAAMLGIRTTPTTLFVDAQGVVKWIFIGKIEKYEMIEKGIETITAAKAA